MKKISFLFTLLILCLLPGLIFNACKSNAAFDPDRKRVIFISPQKDLPVWKQAENGFLQAAEKYGFYAEWQGSDDCDLEEMTRQISIATAEAVDAIIICPLTPDIFDEALTKAREKEIPVITVAVDASRPALRDSFISPDYEKMGKAQAAALHEAVGGPMNIGVIMSTYDSQNQIIQVRELENYIEEQEDCHIVATAQDFANPVMGMSIFTEMLESHPEINAVFVTSGDAVSNYGKILKEKDLQDDVILIGMDAIEANLQAIKEHEIYGVMDQDFYTMGYLSGEYAAKLLDGTSVPSETLYDSLLVTAENAGQIPSEAP